MNDEDLINLIARCTLRDQNALKQLYDELAPWLNALAFRILKSKELSNEALQEAFVQIWSNAATYRPDKAKPITWISSIVRYRALDLLDRERKHSERVVGEADLESFGSDQGTESAIFQLQTHANIHKCLAELTDRVANSIKLAYLYGYSRDELAKHYNTPVNTIKSWLRRGSEKLKLCLEQKL